MIVPMTKFSILVYHRDFAEFLRRLQVQGLLDIQLNEVRAASSDTEFYPLLQRVDKLVQQLKIEEKQPEESPEMGKAIEERKASLKWEKEGLDALQAGEVLLEEIKKLREERGIWKERLKQAAIWGDFDPEKIAGIERETGVSLLLASVPVKKYPKDGSWEKEFPIQVITQQAGNLYFVYADRNAKAERTAERLSEQFGTFVTLYDFPAEPYSVMALRVESLREAYIEKSAEILTLAEHKDILKQYKSGLIDRLSFKTVSWNAARQADGCLRMVEGFVPTEKAESFSAFLDSEEVVYESIEAERLPEEEVAKTPVLLKNNRFARLFEPITLLFSLPNYRELDLTPMLAPFFMAFFGFCLGDAGYGLLLMVAALFLLKKLEPEYRKFAWLTFWFGLATVIFGGLSGTFFGISLLEVESLGRLRDYFFDSDKMMTLSLVIGGIQILFGMFVNVLRLTKEYGFRYAVYKIGWLSVIICGGLLIGLPLLGIELDKAFSYVLYVLVALGAFFAMFFNSPGKNPLFNLGLGLWDTYNMATGLVGDLLSYIRLFALGLTGGILGAVFNSLALDASTGIGVPVVSQLVMLAILLIGHCLNLALCILGALVHPLRLTFVEFYKNAGFEGGGKAYDPFRIREINKK